MAIQNRRGNYADFDPTKMVAGEFAVVQNGDPDGTDGEAVYYAPKAGKAKRLVTADDVGSIISAELDEIIAETEAALADDVQRAEDAADSVASSVTQIATNTADIADIKEDLSESNVLQKLLYDNVPGTIQNYTFTDGTVSKVEHKSGNDIVRSDVFTYGESSITEVRTLATGEALTIVTNLINLETSVTYTVA